MNWVRRVTVTLLLKWKGKLTWNLDVTYSHVTVAINKRTLPLIKIVDGALFTNIKYTDTKYRMWYAWKVELVPLPFYWDRMKWGGCQANVKIKIFEINNLTLGFAAICTTMYCCFGNYVCRFCYNPPCFWFVFTSVNYVMTMACFL